MSNEGSEALDNPGKIVSKINAINTDENSLDRIYTLKATPGMGGHHLTSLSGFKILFEDFRTPGKTQTQAIERFKDWMFGQEIRPGDFVKINIDPDQDRIFIERQGYKLETDSEYAERMENRERRRRKAHSTVLDALELIVSNAKTFPEIMHDPEIQASIKSMKKVRPNVY